MQGLAAISPSLSFLHRMFVAQQIASSNLLLLVTDATCDCSIFPPVLLDAKEVKYILCCVLLGSGLVRVENLLPWQFPWRKVWSAQPACGIAGGSVVERAALLLGLLHTLLPFPAIGHSSSSSCSWRPPSPRPCNMQLGGCCPSPTYPAQTKAMQKHP